VSEHYGTAWAYSSSDIRPFSYYSTLSYRHGRISVKEKNRRYKQRLKQDPERYRRFLAKQKQYRDAKRKDF
jgi:hypothetical protein